MSPCQAGKCTYSRLLPIDTRVVSVLRDGQAQKNSPVSAKSACFALSVPAYIPARVYRLSSVGGCFGPKSRNAAIVTPLSTCSSHACQVPLSPVCGMFSHLPLQLESQDQTVFQVRYPLPRIKRSSVPLMEPTGIVSGLVLMRCAFTFRTEIIHLPDHNHGITVKPVIALATREIPSGLVNTVQEHAGLTSPCGTRNACTHARIPRIKLVRHY